MAYTDFLSSQPGDTLSSEETTLSATGLLATARGSQSIVLGTSVGLALDSGLGDVAVAESAASLIQPIKNAGSGGGANSSSLSLPRYGRSPLRLTSLLSSAPGFGFARSANIASGPYDTGLISMLAAVRVLDAHLPAQGIPRPPASAVSRLWRTQAAQAVVSRMRARRAALSSSGGTTDFPVGQPVDSQPSSTSSSSNSAGGDGFGGNRLFSNDWRHPVRARAHMMSALQRRLQASLSGSPEYTPSDGAAASVSTPSSGGSSGGSISSALFGLNSVPPEPPSVARHLFSALSLSDLPLNRWFLGLNEKTTASGDKAAVKDGLTSAIIMAARARLGQPSALDADVGTWDLEDASELGSDADTTVALLQLLFGGLALVAMALCFFSLLASMLANINEQKREIGVLRALGMRPGSLTRLYVEEAFLLVLCASFVGVAIGCLVAWTFGQQQALFTGARLAFACGPGLALALEKACRPSAVDQCDTSPAPMR